MNSRPRLAARGSQEAGFTQPRDHPFAQPCSILRARTLNVSLRWTDGRRTDADDGTRIKSVCVRLQSKFAGRAGGVWAGRAFPDDLIFGRVPQLNTQQSCAAGYVHYLLPFYRASYHRVRFYGFDVQDLRGQAGTCTVHNSPFELKKRFFIDGERSCDKTPLPCRAT